jgi:hypothetical protein
MPDEPEKETLVKTEGKIMGFPTWATSATTFPMSTIGSTLRLGE